MTALTTRAPAMRRAPRLPPTTASTLPSERLSRAGMVLFAAAVAVAGSGFVGLRPEIMGLWVHPYLIPIALLVPRAIAGQARMPRTVMATGIVFLVLLHASLIIEGDALSESVKLISSAVTVVVVATTLRSERDFAYVTLGLIIAGVVIMIGGYLGGGLEEAETVTGVAFMRGVGNKNSFSLYALPAILVGAWSFANVKMAAWLRWSIAGGSLALILGIFTTANRSGWAGVFLIVGMLVATRFSLRIVIFALAALSVIGFVAERSQAANMIEHKIEQTRDGYSSDELRQDLIVESIKIGLENPLFGAGRWGMARQLARRTPTERDIIDVHNVVGYVIGGFGLPAFAALLAFVVAVATIGGRRARLNPATRGASDLLRMLVVLWIVRGMFSREVLYAPAVSVSLGLGLALMTIRQASQFQRAAAAAVRK